MDYDKNYMKKMAENLENYLEIIENYVIIEGISKEEYDDAIATVKKLIKKLKKGEGDKVFDKERYRDMMRCGLVEGFEDD